MSNHVTKKFKIEGMHCSSCAVNIDLDLEDQHGVKSAKTSYAKQECECQFDLDIVEVDEIVKIISKAGYKAKPA